jgi:hypothetical protein
MSCKAAVADTRLPCELVALQALPDDLPTDRLEKSWKYVVQHRRPKLESWYHGSILPISQETQSSTCKTIAFFMHLLTDILNLGAGAWL